MKKVLFLLILLPLFALMLVMAVISAAPQSVLGLVNRAVEGVQVQAAELRLGWFPLQVHSDLLSIEVPGMRIDGTEIHAEVDWLALYAEEPFWMLRAQRLAVVSAEESAAASAAAGSASGEPLPLALLLNFTDRKSVV